MLLLFFVIYVAAVAGLLLGLYGFLEPADAATWMRFSTLAGIGVTAITSLFGTAVSVLVAGRQFRRQAELEALKTTLQEDIEKLKQGLQGELETLKSRLERVPDAFFAIRQASNGLYYALAELEAGVFDRARVEEADRAMAGIKANVVTIPPAERKAFEDFWQEGRRIREKALKIGSPHPAASYKALWQETCGKFAALHGALEALVVLEGVET